MTMSFLQGTHKSLKGNQKAKATVSAIIDGTGSIGLFDALDKLYNYVLNIFCKNVSILK